MNDKKIILTCAFCKCEFQRYKSQCGKNVVNFYCSRQHRCEHQKITMVGENNPNYDNKWSDDQKLAAAERAANPSDELRWKYGSANRGKKFSQELIQRMHYPGRVYGYEASEETRQLIGEKSKAKFTDEFKQNLRTVMEDRGHWVKTAEKTDSEIYFKQANWIDRMWGKITDQIQLEFLKEHGVFNAKTNSKGVVRDHIYGRKKGFENGVFPEILRHPCNCQILLHSDNVKKRFVDENGISLYQLFSKIENYNGNWIEHNLVLDLIEKYKNGFRWTR